MNPLDAGFRDLYEREFNAVFRAAFVISGDRHLAEDASQEAFARALARWRRLGKETWVAGWVTTTAINIARRQVRRRPAIEPPTEGEQDPEGELDLRRAIHGLPRRQQEAVVLHYLLEVSVHDAARAMGCSEGTVKVHLSRARAALAAALEPERSTRTPDQGGEAHA